jgi:hypothetical protein
VTEPAKIKPKAKALELLPFVIGHPPCWQAIRDRARHLQVQLEAELPSAVVSAARARAREFTLNPIIIGGKMAVDICPNRLTSPLRRRYFPERPALHN